MTQVRPDRRWEAELARVRRLRHEWRLRAALEGRRRDEAVRRPLVSRELLCWIAAGAAVAAGAAIATSVLVECGRRHAAAAAVQSALRAPQGVMAARLAQICRRGDPGLAAVVRLLASRRPAAVAAAAAAIRGRLADWKSVGRAEEGQQVARLARRLAEIAPRCGAAGRRAAADLACTLLAWPPADLGRDGARLVADCEAVLAWRPKPRPAGPSPASRRRPPGKSSGAGGLALEMPPPAQHPDERLPAAADAAGVLRRRSVQASRHAAADGGRATASADPDQPLGARSGGTFAAMEGSSVAR